MPPPGNYRICTNSVVCTVRRCAVGTPSGRALRTTDRTLAVGRDDLGAPVQELPNADKSVRLYRLPLRGRWRHASTLQPSIEPLTVGRGHAPAGELPNLYKFVRLYRPPLCDRHAQWSCPTNRRTHSRRRARPLGAPVQELPNADKSVRMYRPPLRGADGACPIPTGVCRRRSVGAAISRPRTDRPFFGIDEKTAPGPRPALFCGFDPYSALSRTTALPPTRSAITSAPWRAT